MTGNGVLAGLVGITAGTAAMSPLGAVLTGAVAGVIVVFAVLFFDRIHIDDPVGAVSVHGVCGLWGTLAVGLFGKYDDAFLQRPDAGLFYGGGIEQLVVQAIGAALVAVWVIATSGALFYVLKRAGMLRVSAEEEIAGLDVSEHGGPGYGLEVRVEIPPDTPTSPRPRSGGAAARPPPGLLHQNGRRRGGAGWGISRWRRSRGG